MPRVCVLLAGDVALIRYVIRAVSQLSEEMEIAGETDNVEELLRLTRDLAPHVVLIDQDLPHGQGLAAIRSIKQTHPDAQIIVMTDQLDTEKALAAIEAGATGYILKDIPGANLATAIRSVCNGSGVLHPVVTHTLMDRLSHLVLRRGWDRGKTSGLTARELEIRVEQALGRTDEEIAKEIVVTKGTLKTNLQHILRKISARNRAQAVASVLRKGVIK